MQRILLTLAMILAATSAAADPAVIRDGRLLDLALTPTLGRGYSPSVNSLHGVCFDKFPTTSPSFDFDYTFEEVASDRSVNASHNAVFLDTEVEQFLNTNTREKSIVRDKQTFSVHYIIAALTVDSYYSSIDESKAKLSDSVVTLLGRGDMLGFFAGCGTHYIRSISRRSYFLTLFSYTSSSSSTDQSFERKLEQQVRRFGTSANLSATESAKFEDEAKSNDLKIVSKSIGLDAQKTTSLIPFDLASYKETVKAAFKASQDDLVGRITAIEITPWLANPSVLALLDPATSAANSAGTPGQNTTRYERKQLLSDNAEFYLELSAQIQDVQRTLHEALVCRNELEKRVFDHGAIPPALAKAKLVNHRTGEEAPLAPLVAALSPASLDQLETAADEIASGKSGLGECIKHLERSNLMGKSHLAIPECHLAERPVLPNAQLIQDYCMPELAPESTH